MTALPDAREKKTLADANAKVVADCDAFSALELRARQALKSICSGEFEGPLVTPEDDYADLSSRLTLEVKGAGAKVHAILEE